MRLRLWVGVILVCAVMPPPVAGAELAGKILDAAALSKVKTYCVDTSNLKGAVYPGDVPWPEQFDVRELVKRESGPKGLLAKLPWKLEAVCSAPGADAIARVEFRVILGPGTQEILLHSPVIAEYPQPSEFRWRAELEVTDKTSSRQIYEGQGNPLDNRLARPGEQGTGLVDDSPPSVEVRVQRYHVLRQDAAYHALAALVSDVKAISGHP